MGDLDPLVVVASVLSLLAAGLVLRAVLKGQFTVRRGVVTRDRDPVRYWIGVAAYTAAAIYLFWLAATGSR